jgi:hypothetical protein
LSRHQSGGIAGFSDYLHGERDGIDLSTLASRVFTPKADDLGKLLRTGVLSKVLIGGRELSGSIMITTMKAKLWILAAILLPPCSLPAEEYTLGPDSQRHDGVPKGTVTKHTWTSKIFPGTVRDYWIYVPTQYRPGRPAPFMVFQDGGGFVQRFRILACSYRL